jgi:hypothetical protein
LYNEEWNLRNAPFDKPKAISNLDLELRHRNQEEILNHSKIMSNSHSAVYKPSSETDGTVKRSLPVVIDLEETEYTPQDTLTTARGSLPQHSSKGKSRLESNSEERDSVFNTINTPFRGKEQKKDKPISLKRPHYSETALG